MGYKHIKIQKFVKMSNVTKSLIILTFFSFVKLSYELKSYISFVFIFLDLRA